MSVREGAQCYSRMAMAVNLERDYSKSVLATIDTKYNMTEEKLLMATVFRNER